jgi:hypothetical protein
LTRFFVHTNAQVVEVLEDYDEQGGHEEEVSVVDVVVVGGVGGQEEGVEGEANAGHGPQAVCDVRETACKAAFEVEEDLLN